MSNEENDQEIIEKVNKKNPIRKKGLKLTEH